jgi:tetratricopeptide (TPR) repeat protein
VLKQAIILASLLLIAATSQDRYGNCIDLTKTTPKSAYNLASQWRAQGGGAAAMHCQALALLGLGENARAAGILDAAADSLSKQPIPSADLLAQAGNAWLLANDPARAIARLSTALTRMPQTNPARADVLVDRARGYASLENKDGALADLSAATSLAPRNPQILLLRAEIYLSRGDTDMATADLAIAKTLPMDADLNAVHAKLLAKSVQVNAEK